MPNISKIVNVQTVMDNGTGEVMFPYTEYKNDPIRSVTALEVAKFRMVEVGGVRLQIAVSKKTPFIAIRNVGEVIVEAHD